MPLSYATRVGGDLCNHWSLLPEEGWPVPLPRIGIINDYLDASIEEVDRLIQAIPGDEKVTWDELNRLFLEAVGLSR